MLEIKDLKFGYSHRKPLLFDGFSMKIEPGRIYGLLGKNGMGKSTLLYLMSGLLRPQGGEVTMSGKRTFDRLPSMMQDIFIVPEEFSFPAITMKQYINLHKPFYPRFSNEIIERCLRDFDMDINLKLNELSMGQKKKALMCFALATGARLLLMDEPTNGFDIPSKSQMRKVIASNMSDSRSIIISTHQVKDVENLLDHILVVDGGKLIMDCSTAMVSEKLLFVEQPVGEPTDGSLYSQPSLQGNSVVYPNRYGEESTLNLETLFNSLLSNRKAVEEAIKADNNG